MRVVAGKYKGKRLEFPKDEKIRPTADMVKQALFSSLFNVEGLAFLDLFCGCGGIGIEALSRGAKLVHFVDKSSKSILYTKQNLVGMETNYKLFKCDFQSFLKKERFLNLPILHFILHGFVHFLIEHFICHVFCLIHFDIF